MRKKAELEKVVAPEENASKRTYLKQADVPGATLEEALRIPQAILDHYAGRPTAPLFVAKALNVDPKGSQLKLLSGAAIAYGLIEGGSQAASISVTELSRRILRPKEEGSDLAARREAVLRPRVFGEFLQRYDSNPFPRQDIAINVLEGLGVPREKAAEVVGRIEATARSVGFLDQIKDKIYVTLGSTLAAEPLGTEEPEDRGTPLPSRPATAREPTPAPPLLAMTSTTFNTTGVAPPAQRSSLALAIADDERRRRVFITHGKNRDLVEPIRKLLEYGELVPIISVEKQTVSKPVPEKVMDDMRGCGAAIIHVDAERTVRDAAGEDHVLLNPNVLIEIGAAMAFYGRRFILLVREGVKLPSNLQGLYEVRYSGDILDATATIKLLEAIKDIKNYALPTDASTADS